MSELIDEVRNSEIRQFIGAKTPISDRARAELPTPIGDKVELMELQRDAWKEAFTATRSYYRNNNGPNSKRYREAVARLKELKLIK